MISSVLINYEIYYCIISSWHRTLGSDELDVQFFTICREKYIVW